MANQSKPTLVDRLRLPSADAVVRHTLLSPVVTGPLLLWVTKNPEILDRMPWFPTLHLKLPFRLPFGVRNSLTLKADPPLKTLRVLFVVGLVLWANRLLNRLALNHWHWQKPGRPYEWQTPGKETVVITGGCSGFGAEMVKMFLDRTKAEVVVLDRQELPAELNSKHLPTFVGR